MDTETAKKPVKRRRTAVKQQENKVTEPSEYETLRLENIRRNREILESLDIAQAANQLREHIPTKAETIKKEIKAPAKPAVQRHVRAQATLNAIPRRRESHRLRGFAPPPEPTEEELAEQLNELDSGDGKLLDADAHFPPEVREKAIRVEGHFNAWINPELITKYGFASNAAEAWESNGGGKFSFKDPLGTGKKSGKGPSAKAAAQMLFKKNPNAYFYRHTEPGVEQWTGDWTEEEKNLFLQLAKEYGCGDKWGLFASYIPHRVGYQCSNYYRQCILPEGAIFDPNYQASPPSMHSSRTHVFHSIPVPVKPFTLDLGARIDQNEEHVFVITDAYH
ncbi:hypothetical protein BZG36_00214 [Bifiguratus adelaidae]|uniref:Myb-like domain-containing protein n=1 Tax=Bifiguratus adelaidae TaxID=1938954 RepID=A0A261Y8E0_9FUNG|nr:hypothetical protein BZG36_00214 [Bifiguratus adelaidae]